jgi:predicted lipid-binding transport protein (Tim44 family)
MKSGITSPLTVWLCFAIIGLVLALLPAPPSQARMGGGHSYSGGGSRSSGGSGHGSGGSSSWGGSSSEYSNHYYGGTYSTSSGTATDNRDKITLFIEIIILILVIYILIRLLSHKPSSSFASTFQSVPMRESSASTLSLDDRLTDLKARDENFSKVLFLDFACLLYHKYYTYRGTSQFKLISPYLSKFINDQTTGNVFYPQQRVHDIVIGKARIANTWIRDNGDILIVELEANFTLRYPTGEQTRFLNQEQWTFTRQSGLLSPPPAQMRTLSCPACGAPADFTDAGECAYCHSFIQAGEKQWQVLKMAVTSSQPFTTQDPGGYVEERGTELRTIRQAGLETQQQIFVNSHGLPDWNVFFSGFCETVVKPYFLATYAAWSQGLWSKARHLVSDRVYESNNFWMEEYARQGWQNRLENIAIQHVLLARIDLDKFYESITVRVYATCLDYTVDKQDKVIGGSTKKPRKFSEYWTFLRVSGVEKITADYDLKTCPSCGAPADRIGQAGTCGYCGSKISEGQFSWVLATISQDEAYEG